MIVPLPESVGEPETVMMLDELLELICTLLPLVVKVAPLAMVTSTPQPSC